MAASDFLGGDLITSDDPLAQLHALLNAAPDQAARTVAVQKPIPSVPAAKLPSPNVVPSGPMTQVANGGAPDWKTLLENLGPLLGSLTMQPSARTGFLEGWMHGHSLATDEKQKRDSATQARNQAAANYRLEVGQHALAIDDPVQRSQFIDLAESSGTTAGLLKPGDLSSLRAVPPGQAAQARLKELTDQLGSLDKGGYNLDELAQSGSTIKLKDGSMVPVSTALDLTRARPLSATGTPLVKPEKVGNTEEERYVAKWAKEQGKTIDTLTAAEDLKARDAFRTAGRAPAAGDDYSRFLTRWATEKGTTADKLTTSQELEARKAFNGVGKNPQLDDINLSLKQLQLENERKKAAESGAMLQITPGTKEYRLADDLATGRITYGDFTKMLTSRGAGGQNVNAMRMSFYDKAREINPNFSPAMFEMGYKFASNPKTQQQVASINNVLSGVDDLLKVSDAASRSSLPLLNQFLLPGGIAMGSKKYANLKIARTAFADELSGALGYGSATDMAREMGLDMTDPNLSPENFKSALVDIVVPFVNRKKASLLGPMGQYGTTDLNPAAKDPKATTPPRRIIYDTNGNPVSN